MKILKQLKATDCVKMKKKGVWTKHYTMTLWENEEALKSFAMSGAHLEAMKTSKEIAKEIRTVTYEADQLPNWKTAFEMLQNAKVLSY